MTGISPPVVAPRSGAWPDWIGISRKEVLAQVSGAFGDPMLISMTGSLAAGYGNAESDVDVYVVVPDQVMQVPMVAYHEGLRIDVRYFSASEVRPWTQTLRADWPPAAEQGGRRPYVRRKGALHAAVRFAVGIDLQTGPEMSAWLADLRSSWLTETVADWWSAEAARRLVAARWLLTPGAAGWERAWLRHSDAVLAALEVHAARSGHIFFGPKWLSEKFAQTEDGVALADLDEAMRFGPDGDLGRFAERCADVVARESIMDGLHWQLCPASGVAVDDYVGRRLVSRWGLRGVEYPAGGATVLDPVVAGEQVVWSGSLDQRPATALLDLFRADMLWLSVVKESS
jgi:hypothetical protein